MTQHQIQSKKLIFKALVMGCNLELQAGFLNRASTVPPSFQLYSALGLGLGVARVEQNNNFEVAIQLWSLPIIERCEGLTNSFVRGHKAVITVLTPNEIPRLPEILDSVPVESFKDLLIVLVTENQYSDDLRAELTTIIGSQIEVYSVDSVQTVMSVLVNALIDTSVENLPCALQIDSSLCPTLRPVIESSSTPLNTEEEIKSISSLARDFGVETTPSVCIIELKEGIAEIDLLSGSVSFKPKLCSFCEKSCKRTTNICIVRKEPGWSSINLGTRALLTLAKIYALNERELPEHIERQIARATACQNFMLAEDLFDDKDLLHQILELGYIQASGEQTLLQEAEKRVREGRLSLDSYNTIKRMFNKVQSGLSHSYNDNE